MKDDAELSNGILYLIVSSNGPEIGDRRFCPLIFFNVHFNMSSKHNTLNVDPAIHPGLHPSSIGSH